MAAAAMNGLIVDAGLKMRERQLLLSLDLPASAKATIFPVRASAITIAPDFACD